MKKKGKRIVSVAAIVIGAGLLLFAVKYLLDAPYREQLPVPPDEKTLSAPIQEQLSKAVRITRLNTTAGSLGKLGMVYYSFADYERAARCYELATKKSPGDWRWHYYLGYLYLEQGESKGAGEHFRVVTQKDPSNYRAYYYWGEACQKQGLTDSAEQIFRIITNAYHKGATDDIKNREVYFTLDTYSLFQLARIYLGSDRIDSAAATLQQLLAKEMKFGAAYRLLGNVYSAKGDSVRARKYLVRAADLAEYTAPPDDLVDEIALLSRSDEYLLKQIDNASRSGNHQWALRLCNNALEYMPDNKYLVSDAFYENFDVGNDKKALTYADRHLANFSDDPKELLEVTDLLYDKGYGDDALRFFRQARTLLPLRSSMAVWLYDRGKRDEALRIFAEQLRQSPKDTLILADGVRLMMASGNDEQAKNYLEELKQTAPGSARTWKMTGMMAEKQGKQQEALSAYETAIHKDPKDPILIKDVIGKYVAAKNWQQAIRLSSEALEWYPNDPLLLEGMGRLLISCPEPKYRNVTDGVEFMERAFVHMASPYEIQLSAGKSLATVYVFLGDKKKAIQYINKTVNLAAKSDKRDEYVTYFKQMISKG